jgi:hypothetical protein
MFPLVAELPNPAGVEEAVARSESGATMVWAADRRLVLQSPRTSEAVAVRHQLVMTHKISQSALAAAEGGRWLCRWEMAAYLQRDICFTSITGMTGCTEATSNPLPFGEKGEVGFDRAEAVNCTLTHPVIAAAEAKVTQQLKGQAANIVERDFESRIRPNLTKPGVTIQRGR